MNHLARVLLLLLLLGVVLALTNTLGGSDVGPHAPTLAVLVSAQQPSAVPGPPLNLSANAIRGKISLSWLPPSTNGGSPITGYKIRRSASPGYYPLILATLENITNYDDTNVSDGQTYYYVVAAVNSAGESDASAEISATVPLGASPAPESPGLPVLELAVGIGLVVVVAAILFFLRRSQTFRR